MISHNSVQTCWKNPDAPNVTHCPKYTAGHFNDTMRPDNAMFEDTIQRTIFNQVFFDTPCSYRNSFVNVVYKSTKWRLNDYNARYDVTEAY